MLGAAAQAQLSSYAHFSTGRSGGNSRRLGKLLIRASVGKQGLNKTSVQTRDLTAALQELEEKQSCGEESLLTLLDSCLESQDMKLVSKTYELLKSKGLLPSFGSFKSRASEPGERFITPMNMKKIAGLEASQLSPKRRGFSPTSAAIVVATIVLQFLLKENGVDVRPLLLLFLGLGVADSIYFQGVGLSQVQSLWPPHKRRVIVHEAGHLVIAYLLGCPVRGVILDALKAMKLGIQGQAGTQFWDAAVEEELFLGRLTSATLDRYCMVLFAGIAAEALVYGQAEGGEADEKIYESLVNGLSPPWSAAKRGNQARWAVLQSFKLLREHEQAHQAVTQALEDGAPLSTIINTLEATILEQS